MAGAHTKNHDYHLVDPSPWPLIGSISATVMATGAVMWMKTMTLGGDAQSLARAVDEIRAAFSARPDTVFNLCFSRPPQ